MSIKLFFAVLLLGASLYAADRPARVSVGVGTFNTLRPDQRQVQGQLEYQAGVNWCGVQPLVCAMATKDGAFYVCAGAIYDIYVTNYIVLSPSFAPGLYYKGNGKNLGYPLEFRSSIALSYQDNKRNRLGLQFYHISNASLGSRNPGEESFVAFYSISL